MSAYIKPVLVLIVSVLLFAGAAYLVDIEFLDYIRTHFYNPSILKSFIRENHKDAELIQAHINELQDKFASTLEEPAIRSSFLYSQNAGDIYERSRIFGILLETTGGLQSVQFVDSNGTRIHYSTSARDIISRNSDSTAYRNYNEDSRALPYDSVSVPENGKAKFTMDDAHDRIIFSFPFFDSMEVYRGTALFTLSVRALAEKLVAEGRLKANDDVSVTGIPPGVVLGTPATSREEMLNTISAIWGNGVKDHITLDGEDSGVTLSLITSKTVQNLFLGRIINNSVFAIPESMKIVFKLSMFLTLYLTLYFLINIKPNPAALVQNRIKNLRADLFEQLYVNKTSQDRAKWILELEQRREEIRAELKHKLKLKPKAEKNIDSMIDKAWDELLVVIKSGSGIPEDKPAKTEAKAEPPKKAEKTDKIEEAEELGEIEEIEEIDEVEEVEEVEEIEEVEEAEELDEIEEIEEIEEVEEAEELDEIEEIEEIDEVEEIEELEEPASSGHSKGLLRHASEIEKSIKTGKNEEEEIEELEELEELEEIAPAPAAPHKKGLLAHASEEFRHENEPHETEEHGHKGLLAMASEIEFNREYPAAEDDEDLNTEVNIVSPFSSMFSSLDDKKDLEKDPE